jgi:DNA-binding response OmpR family regulator
MIVEDEALIAMSLEDVFEDQGYRVTGPFSSCADALAALATAAPDIAILDATLKDGSCLELARELRGRDIPFLIYSGRRAIEEHEPELAGTPWIDKPSSPEFVLSRAVKLLNGSPPEARA